MEFVFMAEPQAGGTYRELRGLARWAEAIGFDGITRSDHYLDDGKSVPVVDALTSIAALAADTETIKLGVLVSPIAFRHPATLAKTAATIDEISSGRFELGVGTGWMDSEHHNYGLPFPPWSERFDRLEETLAYLWAAFGRSSGGFEGTHYRIADIDVLPKPTGPLPIIIGGSGPQRTPSLAGTYGDELNMFSRKTEEAVARRDVMRSAAVDAGRDPDAIVLSLVGHPIIGDNRADYRHRLEERAARAGREADEYEEMLESRDALYGTLDQVRTRLESWQEVGVSRYYIQVYAPLSEIDTDDVGRIHRLLST